MAAPQRPYIGVFLLLSKDSKVLLLRRHDDHLNGLYMLVAGHVDEGETLTGALIREAKEEAGIHIHQNDLHLLCVIPHPNAPYKGKTADIINFVFLCEKYDGSVQNNEPHKCDKMGFYPLDNLPSPLTPHTQKAIDAYKNGNCNILIGG